MTKIAPSIAYVTVAGASDHATVVSSPSTGSGSVAPTLVSTNEPVPYVFFVMPGSTHACPNSAACWSPAMPLTGTASPAAASGSRHAEPAARRQRPRAGTRRGTSNSVAQLVGPRARADVVEHRAARVRRVGRVHAAVGAAGEVPQDPRVDGAEREVGVGRRRRRRAAATRASSPRSTGRARARSRARISGSWPAARSSSQRAAVRRSCQTIARWQRPAGARGPTPRPSRAGS